MKIFELIIGLLSSMGFFYFLKLSIDMPDYQSFWVGPGAFPALLCGLLALLSLWWVVDVAKDLKKEANPKDKPSASVVIAKKDELKRLGLIIILTLAYIYLFTPIIGFTTATLVFLIVSISIFGQLGWLKSISFSILFTLLVYVAFKYVLYLPMPQ